MKDITPIIETRIANLIFDRQVVVSDLTKTLEDKNTPSRDGVGARWRSQEWDRFGQPEGVLW